MTVGNRHRRWSVSTAAWVTFALVASMGLAYLVAMVAYSINENLCRAKAGAAALETEELTELVCDRIRVLAPTLLDESRAAGAVGVDGTIAGAWMLHALQTSRHNSAIASKHIADADGDGLPELVDSWGAPLRCKILSVVCPKHETQPSLFTVEVRSRGPDGVVGTNDDLTCEFSVRAK